jgi:hypothetical protein
LPVFCCTIPIICPRQSSTDAGRRWTVPAAPPGGTYANDSWLAAAPDRLLGFPDDQSLTSIASDNGGLSWTHGRIARIGQNAQVQAGALGPGGVAIAVTGQRGDCGSQGLTPSTAALFTSANGGASWRLTERRLPFGVDQPEAAVSGSHLAIIDACNRLRLSRDRGRRWRSERLGNAPSCLPSAWRDELWLACSTVPSNLEGGQQDWVLHSSNGGSSWTLFQLPAAVDDGVSQGPGPATGFTEVSATGRDSAVIAVGADRCGAAPMAALAGRSPGQRWPATKRRWPARRPRPGRAQVRPRRAA